MGSFVDPVWIWRAIMANLRTIAGVVAACVLLSIVYLLLAVPNYTATGEVVFDLREPKVISANPILQSLGADQYVIESQVELLKSRQIIQRVIEQHGSGEGQAARAPGEMPGVAPIVPDRVYDEFTRRLMAQRKGMSFVIEVSYSDRDPQRAARIANAVMEAYIAEQRRVKVDTVSAANSWLAARVDELRSRLVEAERQVQEFKSEEAQINARVMGSIYSTFLMRLKETQSQEALQTSDARIVSAAVAPNRPSSPKRLLALGLASAVGLGLGLLAAFWRTMREPFVLDAFDAERLTGLPVLVEMDNIANEIERPQIVGDAQGPDFRSRMSALHVLHHPNSNFTQSIFILKHILEQAEPTNGSKLVAVVSPRSGDGKTTLATNLARYAASSGLRSLLVDADLRTAMATQRVHPGVIGTGPSSVADLAVRLKNTVVKDPRSSLTLYPATDTRHAVARPAVVLASRSFPTLVRRMREEYEFVVIDTPGALDFPDARLLVPLADWVVIVVHAGQTAREDLDRMLRDCALAPGGSSAGKVLGIVVNHGPRAGQEQGEPTLASTGALRRLMAPVPISNDTNPSGKSASELGQRRTAS